MIQTTLFFILGFLSAGFLALLAAPAFWRRAVNLTRKRVEASVPLTLDEIQADKDRMRAEFAMSTRRLEMSVKALRDKATGQILEINRNRDELNRIAEERDEKNRAVTDLEARATELRTELRTREDELQRLADRLDGQERLAEERAFELEKLGRMLDEASFNASARQIEIVAQESKLQEMADDTAKLRADRKEADRKIRELVAETRALRATARAETKKFDDQARKSERLQATVADRDLTIEKNGDELARLRDQLKDEGRARGALETEVTTLQERCAEMEAELAERVAQLSKLASGNKAGAVDTMLSKLEAYKQRLEDRLATLTRENKRLREELDEVRSSAAEEWSEERRAGSVLREQINDLAAEVVNLAAMLDGPGSPIRKALDMPPAEGAGDPSVVSLADRVRALQKAAAEAPR